MGRALYPRGRVLRFKTCTGQVAVGWDLIELGPSKAILDLGISSPLK